MYSCEQDHRAAAAAAAVRTTTNDDDSTSYMMQPCTAAVQLSAAHHRQHAHGQADPAAGTRSAPSGVQEQQQQQPRRAANKKKHGGGARPPSRRSSTTVVATDVANFRAMVQELTGFPPAAIFRPLPRRVHAAAATNISNPFAVAAAGQGCCGGRGQGSETTTTVNTAGGPITAAGQAVQPPVVPQCALPGVFDGLADIGRRCSTHGQIYQFDEYSN